MPETSTTPTPPTSCPPWCTTDHANDQCGATLHGAMVGEQHVEVADGPTVHLGVFLAALADDSPKISLAYTPADGGGGVVLLDPRSAAAVADLLGALRYAGAADALDRAVAELTAPPEEI